MKQNKDISNFSVPSGYFENFESRLLMKIAEEKLPETSGFSLPSNYFDSVESRVLDKLTKKKKPTKVIALHSIKYIGYAAAIAVFLIIGVRIFNNPETLSFENLQIATIDKYINEENLDIGIYEIFDYISDEDISELDISDFELSEIALEDYILNNMD